MYWIRHAAIIIPFRPIEIRTTLSMLLFLSSLFPVHLFSASNTSVFVNDQFEDDDSNYFVLGNYFNDIMTVSTNAQPLTELFEDRWDRFQPNIRVGH